MPTRRLTVSVPQPCHEDWQAMAPSFQGRFCQSCSKPVVDFTTMSDAEVVNWLSQQKGNTCGRFSSSQLTKELEAKSTTSQQWTWRAVALALSAWLTAKPVEAQIRPQKYVHELSVQRESSQPQSASFTKTAPLPSDNPKLISGTILDLETKDGMPGVWVAIKGTTTAAATDSNGRFEILIPENLPLEEQLLVFSFIGYESLEKKVTDLQKYPLISLKTDSRWMGEVVVTSIYKWYTPKGIYYRFKNLFY